MSKSNVGGSLPDKIETVDELEAVMSAPAPAVTEVLGELDGDLVILGAGGKMGPNLVELLIRAGAPRVTAVSRFSDPAHRDYLDAVGAHTIAADLLDEAALQSLPDVPYVFILAGYKFGSTGNEEATWATNTYLPARAVSRYRDARIVYLSSGNVYPFVSGDSAGSREEDATDPVGEYAQSRLGGERLVAFESKCHGTPAGKTRAVSGQTCSSRKGP